MVVTVRYMMLNSSWPNIERFVPIYVVTIDCKSLPPCCKDCSQEEFISYLNYHYICLNGR